MPRLLDNLNDAQREAVLHASGPLLVVAGAGTGKTRVITHRIAHRVDQGLHPSEILAITFTNKAAGEMRERVQALVGLSRIWISTFHAFGARFLRMEAEAAGLSSNFTIFDAGDQRALVKQILKERRLIGGTRRASDYAATISRLKNDDFDRADAGEAIDEIDRQVFEAYEQTLAASQALDFDDLLVRPLRLLRSNEEVRRRFASRFRTVLVDEYQDTNRLQYELLRLLVRDHGDICATGDPDQSIYRWRGAEIRNILEFESDFEGTRVVKLEENYRSTNVILRAASAVISHNRFRIDRELRSSLGEGEKVRVVEAATDREEAYAVARGIVRAVDDGYDLSDVAVFYRTNSCSRVLEEACRRANLPYVIVGAVEFYERREVKDLLAYLRLVVNPYDKLDLARVVNVPARGVGAKSLAKLVEHGDETGRPVVDLVFDIDSVPDLTKRAREGIREFGDVLAELMEGSESAVGPILDRLLERIEYRSYLEADDDPLLPDRLENIEELRRAVAEYDAQNPDGSLAHFLAETALIRSRASNDEEVPKVTLMTLHSAKGLEFPVVFITALEEGVLPHARSLATDDGVEEERRLFYVGMTRAQRRLTLSYARSRMEAGQYRGRSIPSQFLSELPAEEVDGWVPNRADVAVFDESSFYEPDYDDHGEAPFASGDRVVHDHFGVGRVVRLHGFGASAQVTVDFMGHGQKKLILQYARLKKTREQ